MCRWLAYSGPTIPLSTLLTRPDHSLIDQSRHARQNVETTNGDGFGVGWYGRYHTPGLYHDTHPAWNDVNFQNLADHVQSPLFMSHVRAATGTAIQKSNCHPFAYNNWLFQHNGSIPHFSTVKRQLAFDIDPSLFPAIKGSTDSEILFYLALTFGLEKDAPLALSRTVAHIEKTKAQYDIDDPFYFSACASDGKNLWAVRYSSNEDSRTLYHSKHLHALHDVDDVYDPLPNHAVVVVSEPLDDMTDHWQLVPESSLLLVNQSETNIIPFSISN